MLRECLGHRSLDSQNKALARQLSSSQKTAILCGPFQARIIFGFPMKVCVPPTAAPHIDREALCDYFSCGVTFRRRSPLPPARKKFSPWAIIWLRPKGNIRDVLLLGSAFAKWRTARKKNGRAASPEFAKQNPLPLMSDVPLAPSLKRSIDSSSAVGRP